MKNLYHHDIDSVAIYHINNDRIINEIILTVKHFI